MTIYCDRESRALHYAFFDRLWGSAGIRPGKDWRATFYGRTILSPSQKRAPYWRLDIAQRNVLFSSYHISRDSSAPTPRSSNEFALPLSSGTRQVLRAYQNSHFKRAARCRGRRW